MFMAWLMPNDDADSDEPEPDTRQTALFLQAGSDTELQTLMWYSPKLVGT